ncbi:MAG: single-stranded DNA-binding protein [Tetrasphaera jenkinsii]|uniref:single-stranded DNA-binding protein n=1 Tax=Nostocoides jenkinsii TaxID=330834 RepID=UPI000A02765E|nr:single-stranded DNA-binding protein [Tetrasphaera jenkinsii]MCI1262032.1 single-stranded DNA-binding protein [Tetrasphaera jenkinsii]
MTTTPAAPAPTLPADINHIVLEGRVTAVEEERELPSGSVVRSLRVAVRRPPRSDVERGRSDAIHCCCWTAELRATAATLGVGDHVRVEGALRRSVSRSSGRMVSFYEVEVAALEVLRPEVSSDEP